ncbi:hypothetical protein [Jiella pacifica]|uniref:Lipoprotein n=1 Tax=Jiella pacifica TaxID=2696469 RepID=A0A6N9T8K4_9HYPH|nr:hypothetical protein [Jiella pacifica]NDW07743.1 hypothetical protein [Jiella pacifica]
MATKPVTERILHCGTLLTAGMGIALSGCTGTDLSIAMGPNGPIPPADVGSSSTLGAPPVSASALAEAAPLAAAPSGSIAAAPLPPASPVQGSLLAPPSQQVASAGSSSNLRWNTGPQPVGYPAQTSPQESPPQPAQPQLAALPEPMDDGPATPASEEISLSPEAVQAPQQQASLSTPREPSAVSNRTEVQFLPVVGAPQREAELLARALSEESRQAGVKIRPASGPVAPLRLKGYFSAFTNGDDTVLVYVWDVLDESDQRIRRIQGQERVAGTNSDPWSQVDLETLRKVARETFRQAAGLDADVG